MFTGFASENIPAIKVWDTSNAEPSSNQYIIHLSDDCAPLQFIKGGNTQSGFSNATVLLYLPSAPVEGKRIKIMFHRFNGSGYYGGFCYIYCSDPVGGTSAQIYRLGYGQTIDLVWSSQFLNVQRGGTAVTPLIRTGWISENQGPLTAGNYNSIALGYNVTAPYPSTITIGNNCSNYGGLVLGTSAGGVGGGTAINGSVNSSGGVAIAGTANGNSGVAIVGTQSGNYSTSVGGESNNASVTYATVIGGGNSNANGTYSSILGGYYGITRGITGYTVFPASNIPIAAASGNSQAAVLVLGVQTTNATATILRSDTSAATTTNQLILPDNSAYYFKGSITAGVTGAGNSSMWSFEGGIKRGAGVGTTAIVGTPVINVIARDAGASTWSFTLTADTTNGGLAVTVTGQAATTIRWVCKIETTEMTY
jgi:hypothetical protein